MIRLDSVCLKRGGKTILNHLDFWVKKNEKVLISGKSGIGKSTLFKILLGFEGIDHGKVQVNKRNITKESIKSIRQQIFYLSQDIDLQEEKVVDLLDTIWEQNLIQKDTDRIGEMLNFLELTNKNLAQTVSELSGGERQRIGLLICFILNRPIWLLDEPTSALDDSMKTKIADFVLNQPKTVVIISHDSVWKTDGKIKIERWV